MMPLCSIKLNDVQVFMMAQRDSVTAFRRGPILALHTSLKMLARLMNDPRATDVIFVPWAEVERDSFKATNANAVPIPFTPDPGC